MVLSVKYKIKRALSQNKPLSNTCRLKHKSAVLRIALKPSTILGYSCNLEKLNCNGIVVIIT